MTKDNEKPLAPQAAADRAKCGRTTIMRAIENRELHAIKDNGNRWKIKPEDLDLWDKNRVVTGVKSPDSNRVMTGVSHEDHNRTVVQLAEASTELRVTKVQLDEVRADRDAWRTQAQRSLWSRIWGSRSS